MTSGLFANGQQATTIDTTHKEQIAHMDSLLTQLESTPCYQGMDSAKAQADKGEFYYTVMGTQYSGINHFDDYYRDYLKKEYNVTLVASCTGVQDIKHSCYVTTMHSLILEKFGEDFLERTRLEAAEKLKK